MPRDVDPKRTRKALRIVRKLAARVDAPPGEPPANGAESGASYSDWEKTFLDEVGARLEKYGSAFADPTKGRPDEALSSLQAMKLREIAAKASGDARPRKGLVTRKPLKARRPMRAAPERE